MSDLLIGVALSAFAAGNIVGLWIGGRHVKHEVEHAYVTGHVDGYLAAEADR